MPAVAVVGLDALARLEKVRQARGEDLDVRPCPGGVRALNPHKIPHQDVHPQLIAEGGLPRVLVGREGVPLRRSSLLGDAKVRPVHRHKAVVAYVVDAQTLVEINLWFRERGGKGCRNAVRGVIFKRIKNERTNDDDAFTARRTSNDTMGRKQ